MFSSDRILALNVGASKLVLAEFAVKSGRSPELLNYGFADIGGDPEIEARAGMDLGREIRGIMRARGIRPAPLMLSLSGQMVFPRFVKLPAVNEDKLQQMVQYEVEQNVPFPLDEIVWNHQFIGDASTGEQCAMIVAAKIESVREVTGAVTGAGLDPEVVDVAPMALYNCLRYNSPETDGCSMLLDIGSRSTNLIFIEGEKIYSRCIPVAGNAITQEISKVFNISFAEAEKLKIERAFVSLGGVYASTDETDERISKIVRNVVTRLHAEISRSINFYRSQQGGSVPTRLILTGGSAVIPQLDTFFQEKLHVDIEVLNPFNNVSFGAKIDKSQLEKDAFVMAESVGLALRRSMKCPIEINLMPPEITRQKSFLKRVPFFCIAGVGVLCCLGIWTMYEKQMATVLTEQKEKVSARLSALQRDVGKLKAAEGEKAKMCEKADGTLTIMGLRGLWPRRVEAVRQSLSQFPGLWITSMTAIGGENGSPVTGIIIKGRGWDDQIKALEAKGRQGTVIEQLRDHLKAQSVFGKGERDIIISGVKDVDAFMTEFTLQVNFASATDGKDKDEGK